VLAALAEKERMMHLLDEILRADALQVVIGGELDLGTGSCAVVTAPFGADPALGGLGVIGPVRMRYDRVVPAVRAVSRLVGSHLS
jgi:heat-inducible transcriptional repressor